MPCWILNVDQLLVPFSPPGERAIAIHEKLIHSLLFMSYESFKNLKMQRHCEEREKGENETQVKFMIQWKARFSRLLFLFWLVLTRRRGTWGRRIFLWQRLRRLFSSYRRHQWLSNVVSMAITEFSSSLGRWINNLLRFSMLPSIRLWHIQQQWAEHISRCYKESKRETSYGMENFIAYLYCHQFIFHNFKFVLFMCVVVAHVCLLLLHTCHTNAPGILAQKYSLKIPYDFFLSFFLSSSQIPPPWLLCAILYILQSVKKVFLMRRMSRYQNLVTLFLLSCTLHTHIRSMSRWKRAPRAWKKGKKSQEKWFISHFSLRVINFFNAKALLELRYVVFVRWCWCCVCPSDPSSWIMRVVVENTVEFLV